MLARVSNIEAYRNWLNWKPLFDGQEEPTIEDLVTFITTDNPTDKMKAGTAFHKAMETIGEGEHEALQALGYTFILPDAEISLPDIRELRGYKTYGALEVTGQVDGLNGLTVIDHKTTSKFDADRYLQGCQWRFYLDIFGADSFEWNIWEIKEQEPMVYSVKPPQVLSVHRYPGIEDDCIKLAAQYEEFAKVYIKGE